jgi:hypothetical protein
MKAIIVGFLAFGLCTSLSASGLAHSPDTTTSKVAIVKSHDIDTLVVDFHAPAILNDIFVFEPFVALEARTKHPEPRKAFAMFETTGLFPLARSHLRRCHDQMS